MTLCGVEALPKYGMGHEHKDTEDQFGALMLVPTTGEDLRTGADVVPRYGGGVELMDGHLIKAEDKDTFAHLEYATCTRAARVPHVCGLPPAKHPRAARPRATLVCSSHNRIHA